MLSIRCWCRGSSGHAQHLWVGQGRCLTVCMSLSFATHALMALYVMQDFMSMLPMPEYTHPDGELNMVSFLQENDVKPDLGPKTYVAFGR